MPLLLMAFAIGSAGPIGCGSDDDSRPVPPSQRQASNNADNSSYNSGGGYSRSRPIESRSTNTSRPTDPREMSGANLTNAARDWEVGVRRVLRIASKMRERALMELVETGSGNVPPAGTGAEELAEALDLAVTVWATHDTFPAGKTVLRGVNSRTPYNFEAMVEANASRSTPWLEGALVYQTNNFAVTWTLPAALKAAIDRRAESDVNVDWLEMLEAQDLLQRFLFALKRYRLRTGGTPRFTLRTPIGSLLRTIDAANLGGAPLLAKMNTLQLIDFSPTTYRATVTIETALGTLEESIPSSWWDENRPDSTVGGTGWDPTPDTSSNTGSSNGGSDSNETTPDTPDETTSNGGGDPEQHEGPAPVIRLEVTVDEEPRDSRSEFVRFDLTPEAARAALTQRLEAAGLEVTTDESAAELTIYIDVTAHSSVIAYLGDRDTDEDPQDVQYERVRVDMDTRLRGVNAAGDQVWAQSLSRLRVEGRTWREINEKMEDGEPVGALPKVVGVISKGLIDYYAND